MDNELYTNDFEQLLKEQADRFTMQPTKKVWHSIYNDLHPARKWPSIAISFLLVISLLLLGYLNSNNSGGKDGTDSLANTNLGNLPGNQTGTGQPPAMAQTAMPNEGNTPTTIVNDNNANPMAEAGVQSVRPNDYSNTIAPSAKLPRRTSRISSVQALQDINRKQSGGNTATQPQQGNDPIKVQPAEIPQNNISATGQENNNAPEDLNNAMNKATMVSGNAVVEISQPEAPVTNLTAQAANKTAQVPDADNSSNEIEVSKEPSKVNAATIATTQHTTVVDNQDRVWMDADAFYNRPKRNKLKNRLSWQAYITPSLTYRTLFENTVSEGRSNLQNLITNPFARQASLESSVEHKPGPSLELGGAIAYQLAKKWQLQMGAQINYTSYFSKVNNIQHPITTSIAVNNFFTGSVDLQNHSASISNKPGSNNHKLNNYTVQLSLPFGFAYKMAGKDDLKFYVAANLQPSIVLTGSSPLLSSDRLFYVGNHTKQDDASFMRRFNVSMGLEAYATLPLGDYTFMVGPGLRYQLLTTNINKYTVGEKLYSLGIKLGISKKF